MNAEELKLKITIGDVVKILELLGSPLCSNIGDTEKLIFKTVCHHGDSNKLWYYIDSKMFHCYTECSESFDIIELVCRSKEITFREAIAWICNQLNYQDQKIGFGLENKKNIISDWEFLNNLPIDMSSKKNNVEFDFYNDNILNTFQDKYYQGWINEGISIESMKKYKIKYSVIQQKIVIPHYSINNELLGIRGRTLDNEEAELYGKYTPIKIGDIQYSHPLSQNLYGLNKNKGAIKKKRKVMLVESEKGVLQTDTMFGEENFTLALCGNKLSNFQRDIILDLGVEEVIIALDRQYEEVDSEEYFKWSKHIRKKIIDKLAPYVKVFVVWDTGNILKYKESPTDVGKEKLLCLMKNKVWVGTY